MSEPLSDDDLVASGWALTDEQIARITEAEVDTPAGVLALLDEFGRLRAERDDAHRDAVRENARNVQATAERDHLSEENVKLRRERDAARDERDRLRELIDIADQEVETRGETINRLRAELNATTVTAEEGLEVNGELLAENVHLRKRGCPHVVSDGATSHCSLSEEQVREVERQRDGLIQTVRGALLPALGTTIATRLLTACDQAEGKS